MDQNGVCGQSQTMICVAACSKNSLICFSQIVAFFATIMKKMKDMSSSVSRTKARTKVRKRTRIFVVNVSLTLSMLLLLSSLFLPSMFRHVVMVTAFHRRRYFRLTWMGASASLPMAAPTTALLMFSSVGRTFIDTVFKEEWRWMVFH